jgi:hypothetical protein
MELCGKAPSMQMVETRKFGNFSLNGSCGKREKKRPARCTAAGGQKERYPKSVKRKYNHRQ